MGLTFQGFVDKHVSWSAKVAFCCSLSLPDSGTTPMVNLGSQATPQFSLPDSQWQFAKVCTHCFLLTTFLSAALGALIKHDTYWTNIQLVSWSCFAVSGRSETRHLLWTCAPTKGLQFGKMQAPLEHECCTTTCSSDEAMIWITWEWVRTGRQRWWWWWLMVMMIDGDDDWWWLMMIDDDWWWLMMIDDDWWWLVMIGDDWWWLMMIDDDWWWWMMMDDDGWWWMIDGDW